MIGSLGTGLAAAEKVFDKKASAASGLRFTDDLLDLRALNMGAGILHNASQLRDKLQRTIW